MFFLREKKIKSKPEMNKMLELIRILNQLLYLSSMKQNMFQHMKIWTDKWRDAGEKQKQ